MSPTQKQNAPLNTTGNNAYSSLRPNFLAKIQSILLSSLYGGKNPADFSATKPYTKPLPVIFHSSNFANFKQKNTLLIYLLKLSQSKHEIKRCADQKYERNVARIEKLNEVCRRLKSITECCAN